MGDLIEALTIFKKYKDETLPTNCSHDCLFVNVDPVLVSPEDMRRLEELDFFPDTDGDDGFISFRFGSCY